MSAVPAREENPRLDAALRYAANGHLVVPLHTLRDGVCSCSKGANCDQKPGKHPRTRHGLSDASKDPEQIHRWWAAAPDANVGIVTGEASGIIVLDVDGEAGERTLAKIVERFGPPPATLISRTGGGGRHLVFRHPGHGQQVRNRQNLAGPDSKIDVRGDGGYIVAPPSSHASGQFYRWEVDAAPADPAWFLRIYETLDQEAKRERQRLSRAAREAKGGGAVLPFRRGGRGRDPAQVLERARLYLEKMPPAIAGSGGHEATFRAAVALVRGFELPAGDALDLLVRIFNPTCQPPWGEEDLRHKVQDAQERSDAPWGYLLDAGTPPQVARTKRLLGPLRPRGGADGGSDGSKQDAAEQATDAEACAVPTIQVNGRQLIDVIEEAWTGLLANNCPPQLFCRGGALTRLQQGEEGGTPKLATVRLEELFGLLLRSIEWVRVSQGKDGEAEITPARPDKDLAKDMLTIPREEVPGIVGIVTSPVFVGRGDLVEEPGYSAAAKLWHHRRAGFALPAPVPAEPTEEQITAALDLLLDELLGDFPFDGGSDRAHALACLLLPFVRRMIDGCTPLHLISAPSPGSGKGLLANVISIVALGHPAQSLVLPGDEEAARKQLFSELIEGRPLILLDNANERSLISSPSLASVLTSREPADRLLGLSQILTVRNDAVWLMTGNNPHLSLEIARRCIRIRIDPKRDMPWMREGFRHPDLTTWADEHRPELVHACLTLVQRWIAAGRPPGAIRLGSFEPWSVLMGGLLGAVGIEGFLANSATLYEEADEEGRTWRPFVARWFALRARSWSTAKELHTLAIDNGLLGEVLGEKSERSQQTRLGRALARLNRRVFGEHTIVCGVDAHTKNAKFRLAASGEWVADEAQAGLELGSTGPGSADDDGDVG